MFDANYFRTILLRDIQSAGGSPVVELSLVNGHVHRVRSVLDVTDHTVSLATYQVRGDLTHERPRFGATEAGLETLHVVVSYESICAVMIDPAATQAKARSGFAGF